LTAVALADLVGTGRAAISRYEDESPSSPSPEVLAAISAALKVPQAFFLQRRQDVDDRTVFFRSQAATTKRARTRGGWRLEWLEDISLYVQEFVEFPRIDMPDLGLPSDPLLISDDDLDHAAALARSHWRMNPAAPVPNMTALLENQGAIVARQTLDADTLDSMSAYGRADDRPYVIVGTDKGSSARWRFDLAHELGHLLLHRGVTKKQWNTAEIFKRIEDQAHRFAGAFLLPFDSFAEELYSADLNVMRSMKLRWGVSIQLMIMRARQTDLISEQTAKNLWINLNRRGWRRSEPFDEETLPEEPRTLRGAFQLIMENGAQTPQDISGALSLDLGDIEGLVGLPRDYLSGSFAPVVLKPRGQVIGFPSQGDRS
jgi:Zn-dependent peptidase ImmA (M78 family)